MKTSTVLTVGTVYSRIELAERFGITDSTINTGIFRPPGHESVWLFVTEKKTSDRTQYRDQLEGDVLHWDGQTAGRKDGLIINHQEEGLELLLFYRKEKQEFENYGFRYEGPFRYISHEGGKPAHFTLQRVAKGTSGLAPSLQTVATLREVRQSLRMFNHQAAANEERTRSILRQTTYWVFHPASGEFGPGKFIGYAGMDFPTYERASRDGSRGEKFDGGTTRLAIQAALGHEFQSDAGLGERLADWGTRLVGPEAFGNADPGKWQFLVLDELTEESPGVSEEVVEALERNQARGQGFLLSPELRTAIEKYAMDAARANFEALGYTVEDHSKHHPYDFHCRRGAETLYVEVKGTQTDGGDVILTQGEVEFAQKHEGQMALFVLHSIQTTEGKTGLFPTAGVQHVVQPWCIDQSTLQPISFYYRVP